MFILFYKLVSNSCQASWIKNGTKCYFLVQTQKNFKDAQADCITKNANLATFEDQNEIDFIRSFQANWIWVYMIFFIGA